MPRGGKRQGAGRPVGTGKYNETTKAVRLPISLADEILEALARDPQQVEPATIVSSIFKTDNYTKCRVPLFLNPVAAGFPAPTEDYIEGKIDLNRHLVKHPDSTFLVRVVGESMQDAGIHPRDLLVVDRSLEAISGKVVIAVVDGELTVKRLRKHRNKLWLMPENPNFQPIEIGENMELHIWGVVTNVIHAL
ncbi:MAG: LexA family protein [Pseudanabaena sp.]|jgi:DNA polymerase V|nr:translesion error-prone DNA polymerase V autoproteolytic subunit [Pseudanabaena sp. M090S1SP2A07QC]MCA6505159.1 translesion error-prone DNA polymerase V autoproteolytic subunit [Pseudanabaena sp. M172S2SP2A07QC]MCA6509443.1 translesion error-prone DNA polymerase V autoproteolytic subunit [Pseudanabaena sp. M109S1SP2A07QC]MCA6521128.1 translesion error-prone DNA polymerase V autoproteolytic subunit [Pseudanabaena sp. M051S1SP2A07QC]MCA6530021.1 translesion error-prone DNA polymerase V autopro